MARGRNQFVLDPRAQLGKYLHNLGPVPSFIRFGAPKTNRTSDLPLRRGLLYPLSYRGVSAYSSVK